MRTTRNALKDDEPIEILHQTLCTGLSASEKRGEHLPAVRARHQPKVDNRHEVINMQAAQQLALGKAAPTIRHGDLLLYVWVMCVVLVKCKSLRWTEAVRRNNLCFVSAPE